jgi:hypothetical protein
VLRTTRAAGSGFDIAEVIVVAPVRAAGLARVSQLEEGGAKLIAVMPRLQGHDDDLEAECAEKSM